LESSPVNRKAWHLVSCDQKSLSNFQCHCNSRVHGSFPGRNSTLSPDALCFNIFSAVLKIFNLCGTFILNFADNLYQHVFRGQVKICGKDRCIFHTGYPFPVAEFQCFNTFNFIAKKTDAVTKINIGQVDVNRIAFHPEGASGKITLAAMVQRIDQCMQKSLAGNNLSLSLMRMIPFSYSAGISHTIDTAHTRYHR
jgi:hypothetical protein